MGTLCSSGSKPSNAADSDQKAKTSKAIDGLDQTKTKGDSTTALTAQKTSGNVAEKKREIIVNSELIVGCTKGSPLDFYKVLQKLGEGSYGVVWKVKHIQTGLTRAMKKIIKNTKTKKDTEKEILNEIGLLKKMDHPNIVKIFEVFNAKDGYYLVTEFCTGGELFDEIKEKTYFSEPIAANIMHQLFSAVNYCHRSSNIVHRDLKPENILIESLDKETGFYKIKVIDFGTATILEKNKSENKIIGSSYYIAPEVLCQNYNEKCDLWSCGVILYILLSGRPPFAGDTDDEIVNSIHKGEFDISKAPWDSVCYEAKDLIKKLLERNPVLRITAENALMHKWFKKLETKKYFCEVREDILKKAINNLKKYNPVNKLQEVVLTFLVHNMPDIEELKILNKIFTLFNTSSDGKLKKDEVLKGLTKYLFTKEKNKKTIEAQVNDIFQTIDNDNNGYIEFEEFARAGLNKEIFMDKEVLRFAFNFLDKDKSEEITLDEIKEVFCLGDNSEASQKMLKDIINEIDKDGNGSISFKEFEEMMIKILK